MKRIQLAALFTLLAPLAATAQGFGGFPGSGGIQNGNVYNATGANAAGSGGGGGGSGGTGGMGGTGGFGGLGGGASGGSPTPSPTASASADGSYTSRAYALGMSALTSSANACQGSVAIGPFAASYTIEFCARLAKAAAMSASGFDPRSVRNLLCLDEEVRASASECAPQ